MTDLKELMSDFRRARLAEVKALIRLSENMDKAGLQQWVKQTLESRKQEINAIEREYFPTLKCYQTRVILNRRRRSRHA